MGPDNQAEFVEITIGQYNQIQRYINGEMSSSERIAFMEELNNNAVLREYYSFETDLQDRLAEEALGAGLAGAIAGAVDGLGADDTLRSAIARTGADWVAARPKDGTRLEDGVRLEDGPRLEAGSRPAARVVPFGTWVAFAAAACVLVVVVGVFRWSEPGPGVASGAGPVHPAVAAGSGQTPGKEGVVPPGKNAAPEGATPKPVDLLATYKALYKPDKPPVRTPELLAGALTDYAHGRYDSLQNMNLARLPEVNIRSGPNDVNSYRNVQELGHYYKGLSYIETDDLPLARQNLQWVADSARNPVLTGKAQWYLALLAIKEEKPARAKTLLQQLTHNPDAAPYDQKAIDLLKKLGDQ